MSELILTTCDRAPESPRGCVRDHRVRWALEEAKLPYRVESTPFKDLGAEHFAHQRSGQIRWLTDSPGWPGILPVASTLSVRLPVHAL